MATHESGEALERTEERRSLDGFVRRFLEEYDKTAHETWEVLTGDDGPGGDYVHYRKGTFEERVIVALRRICAPNDALCYPADKGRGAQENQSKSL